MWKISLTARAETPSWRNRDFMASMEFEILFDRCKKQSHLGDSLCLPWSMSNSGVDNQLREVNNPTLFDVHGFDQFSLSIYLSSLLLMI